jgi:hypothetical protein
MDGEISIPRSLKTDGIVAAVPKRQGRSTGNPHRFEAHLSHEEKSSEEPDRKPDADEPAAAQDAETQPESSASTDAPDDSGLLDFEA